jgi:hypothetical protein
MVHYLTNGYDIKIKVEKGTFLNEIIKNKQMRCIHEKTEDRINLTAKLNKNFGLRVFNAMFLPIETKNFDTRFGKANDKDQVFELHVICLLNHEIDVEIEAILDGNQQLTSM